MKRFLLVAWLVCLPHLLIGHGFIADTLVATPRGPVPIQALAPGDTVISLGNDNVCRDSTIVATHRHHVDAVIQLRIGTHIICVAPDHHLFCPTTGTWVPASSLVHKPCLLTRHGTACSVDAVDTIEHSTTVYDLSLANHHTFFVGHPEVLAHNFIFVAAAPAAFGIFTTATLVKIASIFGITALMGTAAHIKNKWRHQSRSGYGSPDPWQDPQKPDDEDDKDKDKQHPHGIYRGEDAKYHHKNSYGAKGPPPRNGQKALDNSLLVKEKGNNSIQRRIAIEDEMFVVLDETGNKIFHGHLRTWGDLTKAMKDTLQDAGLVNGRGKILR